MTPPAAAGAARTRSHTRRATPPRRVSGPVRGRSAAGAIAAPPPLALRLGGAVHGIAEHRWLDRIVRGRAWIGILAFALLGIVFMQVSMLRMNAGIGRSVERATVLERQNAALRAAVSQLSSGDRIAEEAAKLGFTMPAAGTTRFLSARGFDARRALSGITAPGEMPPLPQTTETTPQTATPAYDPVTGQPVAGTTATTPTSTTGTTTSTTTSTTSTGTATTATQPTTGTTTAQPTGYTAPPPTQQTTQPAAPPTATPAGGTAQPTGTATGGATAGA
jgi:hypothetical protein